ncbi:TPA: threonylcarbamoyl-AMP synthase [Candidatus Uhrbacteria bacterium]|nr:threonylcarbamoyl-AMP synthase [Candidatus Uhrbacteria bacterium]
MKTTKAQLEEAVALLKQGGVVVFPTETSYGIACDATNHLAVERVMRIKQRSGDLPMALIISGMDMARWCGILDPELEALAKRHWPGPLTVVVPEANEALSPLCLRQGTVGLRVSSHPVAHALVEGLARPIVATSANIHGKPAAYTVQEVQEQFAHQAEQPDLYLDGGTLEPLPPSMIIELVNGEVVVHRQGSFKL